MPKGKGFAMSTDQGPAPAGAVLIAAAVPPCTAAISVPKRPNS